MSFFAAIVGAGVGLYSANKQSREADKANRQRMAGFNQYKPYVDSALAGGEAALNDQLAKGSFTGDTYAGPNSFQTDAANSYGNQSNDVMNAGFNMSGQNYGFGQNSRDLYGQFQDMSEAAGQDRMAVANQYALDNQGNLVNAAMRDDLRGLQEGTLPGINLNASGSGNTNSSRAGVAGAIANRAYDDRRADVSANVMDSLRTQSLNQQQQQFSDRSNALTNAGNANTGIQSAYNSGMDTSDRGYTMGMQGGGALQGYNQAAMTDAERRFVDDRDFASNAYAGYKNGMLTMNGPNTSNTYENNNVDPFAAMVGGGLQGSGGYAGYKKNGYFGSIPGQGK